MQPRLLLLALMGAFVLPGCIIASDDPDPVVVESGNGLLTVDWSIDGFTDPDECDQSGSDAIDVFIETRSGAMVGDFVEYCDAFAMSIELAPGSYFGEAVLLDSRDRARTTVVDLGAIEIFGGDELFVSVDFPASSFY